MAYEPQGSLLLSQGPLNYLHLYYIIRFTFNTSFPVPCVPFSMLDSPSRTDSDEVHFPVHGSWGSRDSVAGMCNCVKECMSFVMYLII